MSYCSSCGTSTADDNKFCPFCGKALKTGDKPPEDTQNSGWGSYTQSSQDDAQENKFFAVLCYLNILVLVPLLLRPNSPFIRFHCNQGLLLLITWVAVTVVAGFVPLVGLIIRLAGWLFTVCCMIGGILNALGGRTKPLPLIGTFKIIN